MSLSASPQARRDRCSFFCWHNEGQNLLHNALGASEILALGVASRMCSCHQYICSCILVHSWAPLWHLFISLLKEENPSRVAMRVYLWVCYTSATEQMCLIWNATFGIILPYCKRPKPETRATTKCSHDVPEVSHYKTFPQAIKQSLYCMIIEPQNGLDWRGS